MAIPYNFSIKQLAELIDTFFSKDSIQFIEAIENAQLINGYDLFTYFPARYQDANKKALLEDLIQKKKYIPSKDNILLTRFYPKRLPSIYTSEQHNDQSITYSFIANVFDYKSTEENDIIDWHMNFANNDIFAYYHSNLLAQDELQVLECPQLGSLREYLLQQNYSKTNNNDNKLFNTFVNQDNLPYPILISNVERVVDLNTTNLYGNNFSTSSKSTVLKSYKFLQPPQITNIVAIEAPKYGQGSYTNQQIEYILQACFTAYFGAKILANTTYKLNRGRSPKTSLRTHIHTGWFGCGAYGGNRTVMIILQVLAAKMAGIDKLIFHTVTDDCQSERAEADKWLKDLFNINQTHLTIDEVIQKIIEENFQWGYSNGT